MSDAAKQLDKVIDGLNLKELESRLDKARDEYSALRELVRIAKTAEALKRRKQKKESVE